MIKTPFYESRASVTRWIDLNEEILSETLYQLSLEIHQIFVTYKRDDQFELEYTPFKPTQNPGSFRYAQKKIVSLQLVGTKELLINSHTTIILPWEFIRRFSVDLSTGIGIVNR